MEGDSKRPICRGSSVSMREARYSGYVVLEYEAAEDPMKAIPRHIKTLRQLIG